MLLDRCASSPTGARPAAGHFGGRLGEVPGSYLWLGLSGAALLGPPQGLRDVGPVRLSPKRRNHWRVAWAAPNKGGRRCVEPACPLGGFGGVLPGRLARVGSGSRKTAREYAVTRDVDSRRLLMNSGIVTIRPPPVAARLATGGAAGFT